MIRKPSRPSISVSPLHRVSVSPPPRVHLSARLPQHPMSFIQNQIGVPLCNQRFEEGNSHSIVKFG